MRVCVLFRVLNVVCFPRAPRWLLVVAMAKLEIAMIRQLAGDTAVVAMVRAMVSHFPTETLVVAPETVLQRLQVLKATG